ncbi:HMCN [Mytilus coruscus]|uniref:HMCN n=1 Tax=Mytilus coruscus TaxID=42192 RepID=A0A6J8F1Q8_MYTCO|nr:HMCN [Mytilus coruscus]
MPCNYYDVITDIVNAGLVKLYGENYVIRGGSIGLNCTADITPIDHSAHFLLENESYASLRHTKTGCYNGHNLCSSNMCSCSEDSKSFFFRMKHEEQTIGHTFQVTCLIKFGAEKIRDNKIIRIVDLPILSMEIEGNCTGSSQFVISCKYSASSETYGFNPLEHSFNGMVIRKLYGDVQGNMSTFRIHNCSKEDSGTYICSGWSNLFGRTIKANKTSNIEYEEPPLIDKKSTLKLSTTITMFSVKFYTISGTMSSYWCKDKEQIKNLTNFIVAIEEFTIDLIFYEKETTHPGYISNLTIKDNTPGQYTLVLQNMYGETRVPFYIPHDASASFTRNLPRRAIYYAAPPVNNQAHTYSITDPHYAEAEVNENIGTVHNQYEEINDNDKDVHI